MSDSFVIRWSVVHQAPLTMGFPKQEFWSGLPFPARGDLPHLGTAPMSPALASGFFTTEPLVRPLLSSGFDKYVKDSITHEWWLGRISGRKGCEIKGSHFKVDRKQ